MTLLGGVAAWPLSARAQQAERMRRIGVLFSGFSDTDPEPQARVEAFRRQLQDVGWIEGRNVHIDLRIGAGNAEHVRAYAQELVGMRPDVLAANASPALRALAQETQTIPIVFASVPDPVANGFVDSLARPGGNITGFASLEPAIVGKWLELLKEIAPNVTQVSVIFDHGSPSSGDYERAVADLAPSFHLEYANAAVSDAAEIERAIVSRARESGGGLVVMGTVAATHREAIVRLAAKYRVPAVYSFSYFARLGGLVSYGVDGVDLWRRAAPYVDRILRGAKPADLPVQRPTKFELVVNLKTAKALGLEVPPTLLARADEVIE
jgi:putative ABC transport system substrate-binding protein